VCCVVLCVALCCMLCCDGVVKCCYVVLWCVVVLCCCQYVVPHRLSLKLPFCLCRHLYYWCCGALPLRCAVCVVLPLLYVVLCWHCVLCVVVILCWHCGPGVVHCEPQSHVTVFQTSRSSSSPARQNRCTLGQTAAIAKYTYFLKTPLAPSRSGARTLGSALNVILFLLNT